MDIILVSTGLVALAEIGDKTQLLAIREPTAIIADTPAVLFAILSALAS